MFQTENLLSFFPFMYSATAALQCTSPTICFWKAASLCQHIYRLAARRVLPLSIMYGWKSKKTLQVPNASTSLAICSVISRREELPSGTILSPLSPQSSIKFQASCRRTELNIHKASNHLHDSMGEGGISNLSSVCVSLLSMNLYVFVN